MQSFQIRVKEEGRETEKVGVTNTKTLGKDKAVLGRTCGNGHSQGLLVFIASIIYTNLYKYIGLITFIALYY